MTGSKLAPEPQFAVGDFCKAVVWRGHVACPFYYCDCCCRHKSPVGGGLPPIAVDQ
ncbi:hypothetical protein C4J98_4430 [Pseudomonas orientalis]|nr:hypothetical protein C4J98_4430 [Pseudomonas orientalis]